MAEEKIVAMSLENFIRATEVKPLRGLTRQAQVRVNCRPVGPLFDPYDETTIEVEDRLSTGDIQAVWVEGSLGSIEMRLFRDFNLLCAHSHREGFDPIVNREKRDRLIAIFAEHVGVTPEQAQDFYNETYERDPMGEPRSYM